MSSTKQHHLWLIFGLITAILFIGLMASVYLQTNLVKQFDQIIASFIQTNRTANKTSFFLFLTTLGNPLPHIGFILVLVAWLLYKKHSRLLSFTALALLLATSGNQAIKLIIKRPRPLHKLISIGGYSFPSGHSTGITVLLGTIIIIAAVLVKKSWQRWLIYLIAFIFIILIGISRIYLNVHYPSDVLGGFLLGTTIVLLTAYLVLPSKKELVQK
ncbi:phosphatase PAP2 family protein [Pediococcus inopinatus]|uniref:Phosphatase PAP2 family protein n=1 Tax=Pediococcus inopinatus TaxID=114090 RepID=A0ABZ0Q603_9LACO|nr:phosphatase PAP2 family protein [Pediococcus inopinatus]WPC18800.1 phosphatase PAP2 family protein [Pediococcus inopinatus]WPC22418.1 phosphatase PAP2 family protein [Pediococcus inopinatus]WPP08653.1 phosphatase PAP2 family protein [Pediococcus inopinatus]